MHAVKKTPTKVDKEKAKYYEYHKSKTNEIGECTVPMNWKWKINA